MNSYSYVTAEEVRRVCAEIGVSDWTALGSGQKVDPADAQIVRQLVGAEALEISLEDFCLGLHVELEHGTRFSDANVTNNHPILTGRIVLAHLKESLDYYQRLDVMEFEADLLVKLEAGDAIGALAKFKGLTERRCRLDQNVLRSLVAT